MMPWDCPTTMYLQTKEVGMTPVVAEVDTVGLMEGLMVDLMEVLTAMGVPMVMVVPMVTEVPMVTGDLMDTEGDQGMVVLDMVVVQGTDLVDSMGK